MVAYYFPPIATSGSMRPLSFVRHLPASGWTPSVIAVEPGSVLPKLPVDEALGARVPAGVEVFRAGHGDPLGDLLRLRDSLRGDRRSVAAAHVVAPSCGAAPAKGPPSWKSAVDAALEHLFTVPDRQRRWRRSALGAPISQRPDVVYATGGPWTSLLVGEAFARRFNVPFIADFRDPWTRNPSRVTSPSALARARRLERFVCRRARHVIANTHELREQFVADYPKMADKFVTITNGFDADERGLPSGAVPVGLPVDRPIEIAHFGTVYGERNPMPLLQAVERLRQDDPGGQPRVQLRFVGEWQVEDDACNRVAARLEAAGLLVREPPVPHEACIARMRQADVLLVLQSGFRLQVPGKIYEYVSTRRPLWLIGGEGATAALVERHGLGLHCLDRVDAIEAVLSGLCSGTAIQVPQSWAADAFDYEHLTRRLVHVFDEALAGPAFQPSLSPV